MVGQPMRRLPSVSLRGGARKASAAPAAFGGNYLDGCGRCGFTVPGLREILHGQSGHGNEQMIWRRLMLAVSALERVPIHVLDRVGRLARAFGAHVDLFHCLYEPESVQGPAGASGAARLISARVEQRRRRLERLADILRDQGVAVSASVRWDFPTYEGIIRQALRHKPDLLIVPAITLGETLRTLLYRERRLIEQAPCPVLFVKTRDIYSKGCIVATVDPPHARDDGADLDEVAIGAAKTLASALAGVPVRLHYAAAPGQDGLTSALVSSAEAQVRHLAELHEIPARDVRVQFGEPGASLALYVREARAQALVIGVGSRPHAQETSTEPLAERLVDVLECDLLVVKTRYAHAAVGATPSPAVLSQTL